MELKLSETQSNFLSHLYSSLGSIKDALDHLGLDYLHFRTWLAEPYFKAKYEEMRIEISTFLRHDNESTAERQLNFILHNGIQEIEEIEYTELDRDGQIIKTTNARKVKSKVSIDAIKNSLGDKITNEMCIKVLAERGLLSKSIARKVLNMANSYQLDIQNVLGDDEKGDKLSDEKSIVLIKQALLGSGNSIE